MHPHLLAVLLVASAAAQSTITIPATATHQEGSGLLPGPGFSGPYREQFLFGPSHLSTAVNHEFVALRLRRNGYFPDYNAGRVHVTVLMSASPLLDVNAPSSIFADNHHTPPTTVFSGPLDLFDSPRLPRGQAPLWVPPDAVTIPFAQPFRYLGGTLCIQVEGRPDATSPADWFAIDAERELVRGNATHVGRGCGPVVNRATTMVATDHWLLRPGSTPRFVGIGEPHTPAVLFLGAAVLHAGVDLTAMGAPGCFAYVMPLATIPAMVGPTIGGTRPGGANVKLSLPGESRMLGASFGAQWAYLSTVGLATSDALAIQLASTVSSLDGAVVLGRTAPGAPFPDQGSVDVGIIAAVQVDHRQ